MGGYLLEPAFERALGPFFFLFCPLFCPLTKNCCAAIRNLPKDGDKMSTPLRFLACLLRTLYFSIIVLIFA